MDHLQRVTKASARVVVQLAPTPIDEEPQESGLNDQQIVSLLILGTRAATVVRREKPNAWFKFSPSTPKPWPIDSTKGER